MTRLSEKRLVRDRERRIKRYGDVVTVQVMSNRREWFMGQTVTWLYEEGKRRELKVTTKMKKAELVDVLMGNPN